VREVSTSAAAGTEGRYLVRRAWRIICSIKTTVVLLTAITLLSLLGTVFPQLTSEVHADPDTYGQWLVAAEARYGGLSQPLHRLGLFNVYSSSLFILLLAVLFLNGLACTANRLHSIWRALATSPRPVKDENFYARATCHASLRVSSREEARHAMAAVLSRHRYRLTSEEQKEATYVAGHKNRFSRTGTLITHSALILLTLGAVWSVRSRWTEPAVILGPGQVFDIGHGHHFQVRHDGFEIERYEQGPVKDYLSHLTVLRNGSVALAKTIRVNDPLSYEGVAIHLSAAGPAVRVLGWDADGQLLSMQTSGDQQVSEGLLILNFDPPQGEQSMHLPSMEVDLDLSLIEPVTTGSADEMPFLALEAVPVGQTEPSVVTRVRPGETLLLSGASLQFLPDYYTVVQVVSDPGFPLVILAGLLGVAGLSISFFFHPSRVWLKLMESELLVAGPAERNKIAFEEHFTRLVSDLRNEIQ
jgi:cytochrome c biogenesis protein ResB